MKKTPEELYDKAFKLKKILTPEEEQIISTSPVYSYFYAKEVIRGRWKEAETIIATDPACSYCYAQDVIRGRWPEAEDIIKKNGGYWWQEYKDYFKKEFEIEEILNS